MGNQPRQALSKRLRFEIFKRDMFCCQYCGRRSGPGIQMHVDHVVPVCEGGATVNINLVTSCEDCNAGKAGNPLHNDEMYLLFARALLCKRLEIERDGASLRMMRAAMDLGEDAGILIWLCRKVTCWQQFEVTINDFINYGVPIFREDTVAAA